MMKMTSVDFLKNELQIIDDKFPNVHIKYGYNTIIETHIVELLPLIEYTSNAALDNSWVPVSLKFMEIYKDEEVAFISSDSTLCINNVIFEFNATCNEESIMTEIYAPLTEQKAEYDFCDQVPNGKIITSTFNTTTTKKPVDIKLLESQQQVKDIYEYLFAA